jgi:hypothetical protein
MSRKQEGDKAEEVGHWEHDEWVEFSMQNFARAYGDDEPDYSLEDIKESEDGPPTDRRDE